MISQAAIYEFITKLDAEIGYWQRAFRKEIAAYGEDRVDLACFEKKLARKKTLRRRAQSFADSMDTVVNRDVTLPKSCLRERLRYFRGQVSEMEKHPAAFEDALPIMERVFQKIEADFIVAYTAFILELRFPPNPANPQGNRRVRDRRPPSADGQAAAPNSDDAKEPQPRHPAPDPGDSAPPKLMAYREIRTHGEGLFIGWTAQKLDADADEYLKHRYEEGKYKPGRNSFYYGVTHEYEGHCLTVAPTGSGKGVGVIIPNLLYYKGSTIVIDPKGENYHVTARFRRELGQRVVLLDPFDEIPLSDGNTDRGSLNPFDFMSSDPEKAEEEAQMIAEVLSGGGGHKEDKFWDSSAKGLLAGLIHNLATSSVIPAHKRNFGTLIEQIYNQNLWYDALDRGGMVDAKDLTASRHFKIFDQPLSVFARRHIGNVTALHTNTKSSIISTVTSYLHLFSGTNVIESMKTSSLSVRDIVEDDKSGFTVYLVIPPAKLASHAKLLTLWISALMGAVMTRKVAVKRRTLFLLDECAQLGTLPQLRSAVTLLRGYGLQTWMFFQDLSQLRLLYPADYETIINNCAVLQVFGHSRPAAVADLARVIAGYTPEELLALSREQQVVSISGSRPFTCYRANYRTDEAFDGRYDQNPRFPKSSVPPL